MRIATAAVLAVAAIAAPRAFSDLVPGAMETSFGTIELEIDSTTRP